MTNAERLKFSESYFEKIEQYFIFKKPPSLPIDTINLANFIGLKFIPYRGKKENVSILFSSKRERPLMCFLNRTNSSIHFNRYLKKNYLNFAVAHEICHFIGNFISAANIDYTESSEAHVAIESGYNKSKDNYLSELIADTFAYNLLYPKGAFISLLLNKNIRKIVDFLSPHYPLINILFEILHILNVTSFFILFDPSKNIFTLLTVKIPFNQNFNIFIKENKASADNVILSKDESFDNDNLTWFGSLLNAKGFYSSIFADKSTIDNFCKQLSDNSIDSIGYFYLRKKTERKNNFMFYGNYSFNILSTDKQILKSINSSFFHLAFPVYFEGRTSGKQFSILIFCIDDSTNLFEQYFQRKKEPLIPEKIIRDFDEDYFNFDIYSWLNRLRKILQLPRKNYFQIYGPWQIIDLLESDFSNSSNIPIVVPPFKLKR